MAPRSFALNTLLAGLVLGIIVAIVVLLTSDYSVSKYCAAKSTITGHVLRNTLQDDGFGYLLVSPRGTKSSLLIDRRGTIQHMWESERDTMVAYLQPSGNLYAAENMPLEKNKYPGGGYTGRIREYSWDGQILWEYTDDYMHHDFTVMPDGGVAYIQWERAPDSFAVKVRGGLPQTGEEIWTDAIVVVDRDKQVVWEWHMYEHLDASRYAVKEFAPTRDWSHANSLQYVEENPISGTPAFLISVRHINRVLLVDASDGAILWESPEDMLSLQHDATMLDNGNILVFDNGLFRRSNSASFWSRVLEINLENNRIVWKYESQGIDAERANNTHRSFFASSIMGGAQRLSNGNTLITSTTQGRILEVAPDGRIVWDYINEFRNAVDLPGVVFKARAYSTDGTGWKAKIRTKTTFFERLCAMEL